MLYIDSTANRRFGICVHCAGGLLVLAALSANYALLYAPTMEATEQTYVEISDIQHSLRKAPAVQREYSRLSRQLQEMERRLANIRRRVPRQPEESEFLDALNTSAKEVGFVVTNLTPGPRRPMGGYSQVELSIAGSATFESICRFVERIRGFPRLAKVVGLDIRADASGTGLHAVTITVAIFYNLVARPESKE